MRKATILLVTALMLGACARDDVPGANSDEDTSSAGLLADSAGQVSASVDNTEVPGVPDAGGAAGSDANGVTSGGTTGAGPGSVAGATDEPRTASPQPTPSPSNSSDAAAILRRASSAYGAVRSMRADFVMTREIPALRQTITSRGTLFQQSPDRIALVFSDPDGDVILSDGQYFWVYYPSVNEDQVIQSPAAEGGRSGVDLQAQFVGNPVERFEATLHGTEAVNGSATNVLTLVPRQRAEYRSLKVWLDTRDAMARRFEIVEHNGSMRRFDLSGLRTNINIPASTFQFTPPAGARVIRPD